MTIMEKLFTRILITIFFWSLNLAVITCDSKAVTTIESESSLQTQLQNAGSKLVVVDFWASWCGPCRQMNGIFENLSEKYPSTVFLMVDLDANSDIAGQYKVLAAPTFVFIRNQKEIDRVTGPSPAALENKIKILGS